MKKTIFFFLFFLIFLVLGILTLPDYNVNWDEPVHFMRGQAYLRYLLTGEKNYNNLPHFKEFRQFLQNRKVKPVIELPRYSLYQSEVLDGDYFLKKDEGHPPLNGILASLTNYIFYQKLGLIGDIESYHLLPILLSSTLILVVFLFAYQTYGIFAWIISALALSVYPLFLAESHNNIKDPVEACFFAFTIYGFYKGIKHQNWKWIVISSIFAGLALGTKFNILFVPFIIFPWFLVRGEFWKIPKAIVLSLIVYPLVIFLIFFASWPFLWQEPVFNLLKIIKYYQEIGTGAVYQSSFLLAGFNTYPTQTIIFTTPLVILFFAIIGILACVFLFKKEKQKTSFLWLLWFLVPIIRVSLPGTSIYGGVRQIMEYIPAMALLAGLGVSSMVTWLHG